MILFASSSSMTFFTYDFLFQANDRFYVAPKVLISSEQLRRLKKMTLYEVNDGNFISILLEATFGIDVLKVSSASGGVSNFNQRSHLPLDPVKLKFVEGN